MLVMLFGQRTQLVAETLSEHGKTVGRHDV